MPKFPLSARMLLLLAACFDHGGAVSIRGPPANSKAQQQSAELDKCSSETIAAKLDQLLAPALRVGDDKELRELKEKYNTVKNNLQMARNAFNTADRKQKEVHELLEKAPGAVQKMQIKWQAIQAQKAFEEATQQVDLKDIALRMAQKDMVKKLAADCRKRQAKSSA